MQIWFYWDYSINLKVIANFNEFPNYLKILCKLIMKADWSSLAPRNVERQ